MKTNNLENIWPRYHVKWLFGELPFMLKYPLSDLALHVGYQSRVSTSFDWLSSSCHHVIMSSTHHVIVSYCHRVIMLLCHRIIVLSCHHVTILDLALHAWYQSLVSTSFDWSASNVPILLSLSYCHNLVIGISLQLHPILIPFRIT